MTDPAIRTAELSKSLGRKRVLERLNLEVSPGAIYGLLGPNGAGKTTAVRILTTLLTPDAGHAFVLGRDVVTCARQVREVIGLTGQYAAVDDLISARENLYLVGRLLGLRRRAARARGTALLEAFGLADAAATRVREFSGGMRRRLDLAVSLVGRPAVLFLDEPTTGLDLASRNQLWGLIRGLAAGGTTVLLTTQYLEEADRLADRIMVIDRGATVAEGTPAELKGLAGGQVLEVRPLRPADLAAAVSVLAGLRAAEQPAVDGDLLTVHVPDEDLVAAAASRLESAGIGVRHLAVRLPSLDEAFLAMTGHHAEPGSDAAARPDVSREDVSVPGGRR
jgi:daunorubicin resistance ABC transporter ATP-binding subunit